MTDPGIPFDIPGYRILRTLGQGGMATVYLACQTALDREVAVKVLGADRAPSEELIKRFENEARTIARLDHPHIVNIFDVGRASTGHLYYTLPYLPNGDLSSHQDSRDPARIIAILRCLADALGYAHQHGIVHRDVKPENVLFDKLDRPLLADFGIALARHSDVRVTREGATLGSSGYMSPEQARGQPLDGRSDLYSLGVMAYELLTGDLPFHGPDALSVALAHVEQPVPRLPPMRRHWQAFMDKALAKDPDERFQDAADLLAGLDQVEAEQRQRRVPAVQAWRARAADWPASLWVGVAAVAGTLVLLAMLLWPRGVEPPESRFVTATPLPALADAGAADNGAVEARPTTAQLGLAAEQLAAQKLVAPPGDNAADTYLGVLAAEPDNAPARDGLVSVLAALGRQADAALSARDDAALDASYAPARDLAARAQLRDTPVWRDFLAARHTAFNRRQQAALAVPPAEPHKALGRAAALLGEDQPALLAGWQKAEDQRLAAERKAAEIEPALVMVPARLDGRSFDHAFELGRTEVTRAEYARFVRATGRPASRCREALRPFSRLKKLDWRNPDFPQQDDEPVVCVSWQDAYAYARWLSSETGRRYRLPTEAEWQHAAAGLDRGNACEQGNVADATMGARLLGSRHKCSDGRAHTAPVARYKPSSLGLYDLAGNASEWTMNCSGNTAVERLFQADACAERVFRGSSWRDGPDDSLASRRGSSDADMGYTSIGFRLLRETDAPATAGR